MKNINIVIAVISTLSMGSVFAEKPAWAGKGMPTAEQREEHKSAMKAKVKYEVEEGDEKLKYKSKKSLEKLKEKKHSHETKEVHKSTMKTRLKHEEEELEDKLKYKDKKGYEKQADLKITQQKKELKNASKKGVVQAQNSKKWWKFWE